MKAVADSPKIRCHLQRLTSENDITIALANIDRCPSEKSIRPHTTFAYVHPAYFSYSLYSLGPVIHRSPRKVVYIVSNRPKISLFRTVIMAARQLCWPPAILFYRCRLFLFFRRQISAVAWPIVTKLCQIYSTVTQIYQTRSEIWIASPKNGGPETLKFRRDFAQLHDMMANISRTQPDVVNLKTALPNHGHSRTGKLNSVYFGPQTANNRTGDLTHPTGGYQAGHCHASSFIILTLVEISKKNIIYFFGQYTDGQFYIQYVSLIMLHRYHCLLNISYRMLRNVSYDAKDNTNRLLKYDDIS